VTLFNIDDSSLCKRGTIYSLIDSDSVVPSSVPKGTLII